MRAIDADVLTEDCKRYLSTLNPDKDGKECTRIHWLIGVLENAPTIEPEPCEDAVSRTDVIDLYKRGAEIIAKAKGISVEDLPHNGLDALMNLPPVTPKRKTGRWIEEQRGIKVTLYKCSECGRAVIDDTSYDAAKDFPFCHCGADMRQREENK